jgi:Domain of unknown function (DUF4159)
MEKAVYREPPPVYTTFVQLTREVGGWPRTSACVMLLGLVLVTLPVSRVVSHAQQIWVGNGRGSNLDPRWPKAEDFDGRFMYCRVFFRSTGRGNSWRTDYPGADNNFSVRLAELTRVDVKFDPNRQPHHVVVSLDDPLLFRCPMLFLVNHGVASFSGQEAAKLRDYLTKGGLLWVDDAWGSYAWARWVNQINRVLPSKDFPIKDIPTTHAILHTLYDVKEVPQVPAINFWSYTGGRTSERGADSATVYFKGIEDQKQRLMVVMTHNTDISDTWEREGERPREYFDTFSPRGYAIGVNIVLYAMTH